MNYPRMIPLTQRLYGKALADVEQSTRDALRRAEIQAVVSPGDRIALTAGSRGITNIAEVLRGAAREIEACGGKPFLLPSMGSHGGATAEGQIEMLESLGVTEDSVGAPILSTMETERVGESRDGYGVFVDKNALGADGIFVINRVKPHTDFRGKTESGLIKMMAIGLGKRTQAELVHSKGSWGLKQIIPQVSETMMNTIPIRLGIAIMENGYGRASDIVAIQPGEIAAVESRLLAAAKRHASRIPFDDVDVLILDYIGKEISGAGMDTNVIGRLRMGSEPWLKRPRIKTIVLRDLTDASHGNAAGTGLADLMTRKVIDKMDRHSTLTNLMVSTFVERGMIPPTYDTDRDAIETALYLHRDKSPEEIRVVRIKSTLHLEQIWASEGLMANGTPVNCALAGAAQPMAFDNMGELCGGYL